MKRVIFLLLIFSSSLVSAQVKHWKNKVWFVPPAIKTQRIEGGDYLIFDTKFPADQIRLLDDGTLVVKRGKWLQTYDASLQKTGELDMQKRGISHGFRILAVSNRPKSVILGIPLRDKKQYELVRVFLPDMKTEILLSLTGDDFPGMSPNARVRRVMERDKSFAADFRWLVYQSGHFRDGFVRGDTLYVWHAPDYGQTFGRLYAVPLRSPRLILLHERFDRLFGHDRRSMVYSILTNDDASDVSRFVIIRHGKSETRSATLEPQRITFYRAGKLFTAPAHTIKIYDLPGGKVQTVRFPGDHGLLLAVSNSGNRLFGSFHLDGKIRFGMYDLRSGKWTVPDLVLTEEAPKSAATYDGEYFVLSSRENLITGYFNDDSRPLLSLRVADTVYTAQTEVRPFARDCAFVSGLKGIYLDGKPVKSGTGMTVSLHEGENTLRLEATDRAGNKSVLERKLWYFKK